MDLSNPDDRLVENEPSSDDAGVDPAAFGRYGVEISFGEQGGANGWFEFSF